MLDRRMRTLWAVLILQCAASMSGGDGWKDNLDGMRIPAGPAKGRIRGVDFKVERAEIRGTHLGLIQGKELFADREFVILMQGTQAGVQGKTFNVREEQEIGPSTPHIHMSWKAAHANLPKTSMYMQGYLMRLALGRIANGRLPGRIYLCIPDFKRSYVAGSFVAAVK